MRLSGKILKRKYNSAQLKIYQQRQEHPAAGNACIEGQGGTDTDFQTERGKESFAHEIHVLNDQLYSSSCGEQEPGADLGGGGSRGSGPPLSYMKNDVMRTVICAAFCMFPSLDLQHCPSF